MEPRYGSLEYYKNKFTETPKWRTKETELALALEVILKPYEDGTTLSNDDIADYTRNLMQAYRESK